MSKLSDLSDEDLMELYRQGDQHAFDELYKRYERKAYGYLQKRIQDPQAVSDIFQSAFLKLHKSKHQFNSIFMFAPWLFTVIKTSLLDWQKNSENKIVRIEMDDNLVVENSSLQRPTIDKRDISQLPRDQRSAVEMRYFEDLSFEEIAERLETSPANVRKLVSRGVSNLRSIFAKDGE